MEFQPIINGVASIATEVVTVLVLTVLSSLAAKARKTLEQFRQKNKVAAYLDELGIIDNVTDRVVEYAEAELKGHAGKIKRDFAVEKALEILASKGIQVGKDEVIAGIENGLNKFKQKQQ